MAATLPKLEGEIIVSASTVVGTMTVGATPKTIDLAAGTYYMTDSSSSSGLLAALKAEIELEHGGTATLSIDDNSDTASTGRVTVAFTSAFTWSWTSTAIRDILGFTGGMTGTTTYTGTDHARYFWLPNVGRTEAVTPELTSTTNAAFHGHMETDSTFSLAPSGASKLLAYTPRYVDSWTFAPLKGYKTYRIHETLTNESLQRFYTDVIGLGRAVRYFPLRDTDSAYGGYVVEDFGAFEPRPMVEQWVGSQALFSARMRVRKKV